MIGLPFETNTMAKDTLLLNKQLNPDYGGCCYFYPFPGKSNRFSYFRCSGRGNNLSFAPAIFIVF